MEAGKHVYSAVPVVSLPDGEEILHWCDRLVETCRRTGMLYMLGETTYYRPQTMYCRRRASEEAFGRFVYAEGEYFHDYESPQSNLKKVQQHRLASQAGREWLQLLEDYRRRGAVGGPMHYPTHSVSGPMSVMRARALKVSAWPFFHPERDPFFGPEPSNETALFLMSNGATMRICEFRQVGLPPREIFRIYGTRASFENDRWCDKEDGRPVSIEEMRDPLPAEVLRAFQGAPVRDPYGGHGGSHAYLVHEFVEAVARERLPAINAWEAVRYTAAGVAAHKSAMRDGETVEVPDWGDPPTRGPASLTRGSAR